MSAEPSTPNGAPDLGALFDEHMADEFVLHSAEAAVETMTPDPSVLHVPTSIGGRGRADVLRFYRDFFVDTFPPDFTVTPLTRTVGEDRVVDEMVVSFTHTTEIPIFLPAVAPTGLAVRIPLVAVVGFDGDKIASEHLYWDQAGMLVQVGLLDPALVPVHGVAQTEALESGTVDNALLPTWRTA